MNVIFKIKNNIDLKTTTSSNKNILYLNSIYASNSSLLTSTYISSNYSISTLDFLSISKTISTSALIYNFMPYHIEFDNIDIWPSHNINNIFCIELDSITNFFNNLVKNLQRFKHSLANRTMSLSLIYCSKWITKISK